MTADETPDLVVVGRIVKPHGIRGELAVDVLSDVPGRLDAGTEVVVDGARRTIRSSRVHQGRVLITFDGVPDRTAAEQLRGATVEAEPVDLADSDVYWAHELVGMAVVSETGQPLGIVTDLIELPDTAGYDLLEVDLDGTTWLLPAADDLVEVAVTPDDVEVLVVVDPPAGLLPGTEDQAVEASGDD